MNRLLPIVTAFLLLPLSVGATNIEIKALFSGKAYLSVDGKMKLLGKGDSFQSVRLLEANGRYALLKLPDGSEKKMYLNDRIHQSFKKPDRSKLTLYHDDQGMFEVSGSINGRSTRFLLDTGATAVTLSGAEAAKLGIDIQSAPRGYVTTASEQAAARFVTLSSVKIGDIQVPNVDAVIIEGDQPDMALLGMTFLQHLRLQRNGASMVLEKKY